MVVPYLIGYGVIRALANLHFSATESSEKTFSFSRYGSETLRQTYFSDVIIKEKPGDCRACETCSTNYGMLRLCPTVNVEPRLIVLLALTMALGVISPNLHATPYTVVSASPVTE